MSFVWLGLAVLVLPTPGGKAPDWIRSLMTLKPPMVPFPIIASVVLALVVHVAPDALGLGHGAARRGRQPGGAGAGGLVDPADQDDDVRAGGVLRRAVRHGAGRADHLRRCQHRAALHAAVDRRA